MTAFILDCSVSISWLLPDESYQEEFLNQVTEQGAMVPSLWILEVSNVLLMAQRRQRITIQQRQEALHILSRLPIIIDHNTSQAIWFEIVDLADRHHLTVYDACYLELALRQDLPLATYDKSLLQAAKAAGVKIAETKI